MEVPTQPVIKKTKRLTSVVWNDFERVKRDDNMVAICKHCKKKLSGSSTSGTSHLRNHLKRCLRRTNRDISQQLLVVREKKKHGTIELGNFNFDQEYNQLALTFDQEQNQLTPKFDQERSRFDLARMIILHEYPLAMVEHIGFKRFVENLQPLFHVMSSDGAKADCMQIYEKEKQKVYEMLDKVPGRISLTVDTWTSQDSRYLCLTAQYITEAWLLERRILNFISVDPNTEHGLSETIISCLMDWDIDRKLFAITFDNCSSDENAVQRIRDRLSQNRLLLSNGQLFHVCCVNNILDLIVQDALDAIHEIIYKIRESIRYVRSSESAQQKFSEMVHLVQVNSNKNLSLDCPTQWISTYFMLDTAIEYKDAFSHLQECDSGFTMAPSDTEWERAIDVTGYLKIFVEVKTVLSNAKSPASNHYFPEIFDIHLNLIEWSKNPNSIGSLAKKSKCKFDAYWSICNLKLAIAAILDPRFKMKLVEYYYPQIYGTSALDQIKNVSNAIRDLYNEYAICSTLATLDQGLTSEVQNSGGINGVCPSGSNETGDRLRGFDKFLHETSNSSHMKSELDKYLEEPVFPRNMGFNILSWWKVNSPKFPILSMMARDVLSVSMSIASSPGTIYNTGSKVLDSDRSSLSPDILQALICTHDWLQSELC